MEIESESSDTNSESNYETDMKELLAMFAKTFKKVKFRGNRFTKNSSTKLEEKRNDKK